MDLVSVLKNWFPDVAFIAEDLGYLTPEVVQLLKDSEFPGMKVLEFAFDSREPSDYLPHTYTSHCVCYVGTHDNETVMAWKDAAAPEDIEMAVKYLGLNEEEGFHWGVIRGGMSSVADLFVTQMQDFLALGAEARMNTPSTLGTNWQWRLTEGQITETLTSKIADMTRLYGRSSKNGKRNAEKY
jgi:4-alpha-glucanotransferase